MLHIQTVENKTLEILHKLGIYPKLMDFFLVSGTALSLQIGHRKSLDLDFFIQKDFDTQELSTHLYQSYGFDLRNTQKNTLLGEIEGIKVDFITHSYPIVKPPIKTANFKLASLEDIAAMKLNATTFSGTRAKDFVDILYLSKHLSLNKMLNAFEIKYPSVNRINAIRGLAYFEDVQIKEDVPQLIDVKFDWKFVKKEIKAMIKDYIKGQLNK